MFISSAQSAIIVHYKMCYDLERFYVNKLSLYIFDLSARVCVYMFVFQVGVVSINQLEVVIGPSVHTSQI